MIALRNLCLVALLALPALTGCKLALPGQGDGATAEAANPITGEAIETTPLGGTTPAKAAAVPDASATAAPAGIAGADAATTPPAGADQASDATTPQTGAETAKPEPKADADAVTQEVAPPPPPKPPEQLACEKKGGEWAKAGDSGARSCVRPMRDGGKHCTKGSQCEGDCLARSQSCSPIAPLFGCNDVLQDNGVRMTQCIE